MSDQDHCLTLHIRLRTIPAIYSLTTLQLSRLIGGDHINNVAWNSQVVHYIIIEHAYATASDCPHRQFFMTGNAKLSYEENIQRYVQSLRDFISHRHTAARQRQH